MVTAADGSPESYLDALFFVAGAFFGGFVVDFGAGFFLPVFFELPVEPDGLTMAISFAPMGEPRPVQASQPGPALKPTGVPE